MEKFNLFGLIIFVFCKDCKRKKIIFLFEFFFNLENLKLKLLIKDERILSGSSSL